MTQFKTRLDRLINSREKISRVEYGVLEAISPLKQLKSSLEELGD